MLCGLEGSQGSLQEVFSSASTLTGDTLESSDDLDPGEDGENEAKQARKKKNKRRKGTLHLSLVMHWKRVEDCVSFQRVAPFPLYSFMLLHRYYTVQLGR